MSTSEQTVKWQIWSGVSWLDGNLLRLADEGAGEAKHLRLAADTDIL